LAYYFAGSDILWDYSNMEPEYLTVEQVAEKLQMHPTIIRRMLANGELPGRKVGKAWRVIASELREFMTAKPTAKKPPTSEAEQRHPLLGSSK
jgi:excisionase family DNA binding protein